MTPDMINGGFEFIGALLLALNVKVLWRDRCLKGVHFGPTVFFTGWGVWNLYFYPSLDQWWSFTGGCAVLLVNLLWLGSLLWIWWSAPSVFSDDDFKFVED